MTPEEYAKKHSKTSEISNFAVQLLGEAK